MNWFEQLGCLYAKPASELHDVDEANISLSSLDAAHVIAMQIRQFGQFFLREISVKPEPTNIPSEGYARV